METINFNQLVDLTQVRQLLESHHLLSGMAYGLFDADENNLVAIGWQDICTCFHRTHPVTAARCRESDAFIKAGLFERQDEYMEYRCKNGMIDIAIPVIIDNKHLATFFTGQFFYDDDQPDRNFFVTQAAELGLDAVNYLAALDRVPVFSRAHVQGNLLFLYNMVRMMAEMGMKNFRLAHEMEERKSAQAQLEDERLLLQTLIQTLPDPVWLKDPNGTFLACNGAFGLLFNDTPSCIVGRRDNYYVGDELATFFQQKDREAIALGRSSTNEEWLTYASDGRHVLWETTKTPVYDAKGQAVGVLGIARDITRHRLLEDELRTQKQYQQALLDNFPFMVWLKDSDSRFLAVNRVFLETAGLAEGAPYFGKTDYDLFGADLADHYRIDDLEVMASGQKKTREELVGTANKLRWHETYKAPVFDKGGKLLGTVGFSRDISVGKWMEEHILKLNAELSATLQTIPDPLFEVDRDGTYLNVWSQNPTLLAQQKELLLGRTVTDILQPEAAAVAMAAIREADATGSSYGKILRIDFPEGPRWFELSLSKKSGGNGTYARFMVLSRDITERKRMEEDILKLNAELSATLQTIPDLLFELDSNGAYLNIWAQNPSLLAAQKEQLLGRTVRDVLSAEAAEVIMAALREADESGSCFGKVIRIDFPEGPKWFEHSVSRKCCVNGIDRHFMLLSRDVTERKRMEETLAAREQEFRTLAENSPDNISRFDSRCRQIYLNPTMERTFGLDPAWLLGKTPIEQATGDMPRDLGIAYEQSIRKVLETGEPGEFEMYMPNPAGGLDTHLIRIVAERDTEGTIIGALAIGRDITQRKRMEEALYKSSQMLEEAQRIAKMGSWELDLTKNTIRWSDGIFNIFAIEPYQLDSSYEAFLNVVHPDDREMVDRLYTESVEKRIPYGIEHRLLLPDGRIIHVHERCETYYDDAGAPLRTVGTIQDITERKLTEQRLELMSFALDHVGESALLVNEQGQLTYVNDGACRTLGYSRDELLALSVADLDPDWPAEAWPDYWQELQRIKSHTFEGQHKTKDGCIFPVEINANYFEFCGQGYNLGLVRDITERKRAEQELLEREQQFRTLAQNLPDNISRYDLNCRRLYINPQLEKTLGRPAVSLIGLTPFDGYGEGFCVFQQTLEQVLADGQEAELDLMVPDAEKGERYHNIRFVAERDADGTVTGAMVIGRDITERKQMEEALQAERNLFVGGPNVAFRWRAVDGWPVEYVSPNITVQFGYTTEDFTSGRVAYGSIVHPEDQQRVAAEVSKHCAVLASCFEQEYRVLHADGSWRWIYDFTVVVRDASGTITHFHGYIKDITRRKQAEEALREREQQFRTLIDNIPDQITGFDAEGRVRYINPAITRDFGVTTDLIAGMTLEELSAAGAAPEGKQFPAAIRRAIEERTSNSMEAIWQTLHGKRIFDVRHIPELDADGVVTGVLGIARDITEQMEMEASLRKSSHLLAEAQRIAHIGSWELELATNRLIWSDEIYRIFEIEPTRSEASYGEFLERIHPDDRNMVDQAYRESTLNRTPYNIEHRLLFPDGRIKYVQERCETYYNTDGTPLRSLGTVQDITERKQAEKNLLSKQHKLAELELELSFAEERERQRIAAVLHDHIGQLLLLGRIKLGTLLSADHPQATLQTVSDVRALVDEAIKSTRSLTVQLCPPVLSTMGLEPALELLCRQMLEEWELQVAFSDDLQPKPLSPEMRTVLYQAARELLINVGKHAGTNQARLAISRDDGMFLLTVGDNGTGFDPDALAAASRQAKGFGLFNVMRRIRNLGGEMTMDSSPLQGTRIVIRIPLESTGEGV